MSVRRVALIHGSDTDLPQMLLGMRFLLKEQTKGNVVILSANSTSQHRHTVVCQLDLEVFCRMIIENRPDILIVGAGWANHLTGCTDAFLRNTLRDTGIIVYGVAFEDPDDPDHTETARRSIIHVPKTQVIYKGIGAEGFLKACKDSITEKLPKIVLNPVPKHHHRSLEQAIAKGEEIEADKKKK